MFTKEIILWLVLICLVVTSGCTQINVFQEKYPSNKKKNTFEDNIIENYLKEDLWTKENIYDSSHVLQVPLEAAFRNKNEEWKLLFSDQFSRFVENYNKENTSIDKSRLNFLHYLYISSKFINSAYQYEELDLIPKGLIEIVHDNMVKIFYKEAAWQWDREPFENMQERLLWKLRNEDVKKSYYRAIIDEELFIFAIAANLRPFYIESKSEEEVNQIEFILKLAFETFKKESYFSEDGNWLFQVGVWEDHPDYKYAGNLQKSEDINPHPVVNIATDSSHFHRFPLFVNDFISTYKKEPEKKEFFIKVQKGLKKQFLENVLVNPSEEFKGYRLNNYMDGHNGVYRWNYATQGPDNGYGPYELSGTFFLGWWSFLEADEIKMAYKFMAEQFPLEKKLINTYVGPNTTRERNKYVRLPDYFENGFAEIICRLIVDME